jgi:phytoene/squalene synthetase
MSSYSSFWRALSSYCDELAPVVGPLLSAIGATATAVDRASDPANSARTTGRTLSCEAAPASRELDA